MLLSISKTPRRNNIMREVKIKLHAFLISAPDNCNIPAYNIGLFQKKKTAVVWTSEQVLMKWKTEKSRLWTNLFRTQKVTDRATRTTKKRSWAPKLEENKV
jgi:hypothetical protein